MEQFVLNDIFDTKGIEYIIVISFFMVLLVFWHMLNRPLKVREVAAGALKALNLDSIRLPRGLFFNRNHTWSYMESSGVASVGMDDMLLHLTGGVELSYLKEQEEKVSKGEAIARISQQGKELVITSPISGVVDRVHASLEKQGEEQDPYKSWLYHIRPADWKADTKDAMMADEASQWTSGELERVKDYMAAQLSDGEPVLQAGGGLTAYPLKEMDGKAWNDFQEQFLEAGA